MKTNVKIIAKNAIGKELASIDAAVQVNAVECVDVKSLLQGFVDAVLTSAVMKNFGLRAAAIEYLRECTTTGDKNCYDIAMQMERDTLPNRRVLSIRPGEKEQDTSTELYVHMQFGQN